MRVVVELDRLPNGHVKATFHGHSIQDEKLWGVLYRLADDPWVRRRLYADEELEAFEAQPDETLGVAVDGV